MNIQYVTEKHYVIMHTMTTKRENMFILLLAENHEHRTEIMYVNGVRCFKYVQQKQISSVELQDRTGVQMFAGCIT